MEELNSGNGKRTHKLMVLNRKTCAVSGVTDVLSFDVNEILLDTEQGLLMIKGSMLHVTRLTLEKGEVDMEGEITSLTYSESNNGNTKGESFITRLFK